MLRDEKDETMQPAFLRLACFEFLDVLFAPLIATACIDDLLGVMSACGLR